MRQAVLHQMMGTSEAQRLRLRLVAADFLERMGGRIRRQRDSLGLSRAEVARRMPGKVNENQVYRWEKGLHQPNPDTLEALATVLECDVATFMAPEPETTETPEMFPGNGQPSQLDRIEEELAEIKQMLAESSEAAARVLADVVDQVRAAAASTRTKAPARRASQKASRRPESS